MTTDVVMPDTDGLEVARALHRELAATRIIAMFSDVGDMDFLDVAEVFGAHRTLRKPFMLNDLLHTIRQELRTRPRCSGHDVRSGDIL